MTTTTNTAAPAIKVTAAQKKILATVTDLAGKAVTASAGAKSAAEAHAVADGVLFAAVAQGFGKGITTALLGTALTEGGYKADDTTAGKLARAGRILLIDSPADGTDPVFTRAHEARTLVNNAIRTQGVGGLSRVDDITAEAKSTDEALTNLAAAIKSAKDAAKAGAGAEGEGAEGEGEAPAAADLGTKATHQLEAALKCLQAAINSGALGQDEHLALLQSIAATAGAAALIVEQGAAEVAAV